MVFPVRRVSDTGINLSPIYDHHYSQQAASITSNWSHRVDNHPKDLRRVVRAGLIGDASAAGRPNVGLLGEPSAHRRRALNERVAWNQPVARAGDQHHVADDVLVNDAIEDLVRWTRAVHLRGFTETADKH